MTDAQLEQLRYPVGRYQSPEQITPALIEQWIQDIEQLPQQLSELLTDWTSEQLATPYREGGWSVKKLIHHIADSHLNSYARFKWALTEDQPTIKAYDEQAWAELPDCEITDVQISLQLLQALHHRWVHLLRSLSQADLEKSFVHPETGKSIVLDENIAHYAWHSRHHLAHIIALKTRNNW